MPQRYTGKVPCPGCQTPGTEKPRDYKDSLCYECKSYLKAGREYEEVLQKNDIRVSSTFINWYFFDSLLKVYGKQFHNRPEDEKKSERLGHLIHTFLKSVSLVGSHVVTKGETVHLGRTGGRRNYPLPEEAAKCLDEIQSLLSDILEGVMITSRSIEREKKDAVYRVQQEERQKIFNEGVAAGKNLLMQLNSGAITMQDFDKTINKYTP